VCGNEEIGVAVLAHVKVRELGLGCLCNAVFSQLKCVVARVDDVVLAQPDHTVLCHFLHICIYMHICIYICICMYVCMYVRRNIYV